MENQNQHRDSISQDPPLDKHKIAEVYTKSNYRVLGPSKHSAIKPCHWQEQRLLTGRKNRNCYKGYFGIDSHLCVQNTPSLPFCNHQCVFCWRDLEHGAFGSEWQGPVDSPQLLADEMIRHGQNVIFHHLTKNRSLENLDLMHRILEVYLEAKQHHSPLDFSETQLTIQLHSSMIKMHRAMLLLKNCGILLNNCEEFYHLNPKIAEELVDNTDIRRIIARDITTIKEIEQIFQEAKHPRHAAISLAGEPLLYPRIGELVQEFRNRKMSTFIVTNGTQPEVLKRLAKDHQLPTQLYVSLPAPTYELYLKICRPMESHSWEKILETIRMLPSLECRTVIRITAVKYLNIEEDHVKPYIDLIRQGIPHFIDIKGFTVEANAVEMQNRFKGNHDLREYPPTFEDLLHFAQALEAQGGFEIIATHEISRDILLRGTWTKGKPIELPYNEPEKL
jgi:wyosine [tRNA(Phe)-imidazoG37] synthetase (radical SAM superfamily)